MPQTPLNSDMTPGMTESDMTGDATEQVAAGPSTAAKMGTNGDNGSWAGAFGSAPVVRGSVQSAAGAVTEAGQRLQLVFPPAPGGNSSPQIPGEVPDYSTIPDERVERSPRVRQVQVPQTQAGTAAGIMGFNTVPAGEEPDAGMFELGPISGEEARKATPVQATPRRPEASIAAITEAQWVNRDAEIMAGDPAPLSALTHPVPRRESGQ